MRPALLALIPAANKVSIVKATSASTPSGNTRFFQFKSNRIYSKSSKRRLRNKEGGQWNVQKNLEQTLGKNKKASAYCTPRELRRSESLDSNSARRPD
jgi:hypothetical protein